MTLIPTMVQSRNYLLLTVAMITSLVLLINASFKIIVINGFLFTASSILCPLIAGLYLLVLHECNPAQQRRALYQSILALYLFSIGIFILVNLPAVENIKANIAYEIMFKEIPRKFFSSTLAFGLGFYLPFLCLRGKMTEEKYSPKKCLLLALLGGFFFFSIDFLLLFADPNAKNFLHIYLDSLMVSTGFLVLTGLGYSLCLLRTKPSKPVVVKKISPCYSNHAYQYLVGFSVIILLICLSCEYRLISFANGWVFVASSVLFPFCFVVSNVVGELYGYKANLNKVGILLLFEVIFNVILLLIMVLPSPEFFDMNPYYSCITPRRIPAATLALVLALGSNAYLLEKLKNTVYGKHQVLRIFIANIISNSLLCLVNYTILFAGIYPYELIVNLAMNSWLYKLVATVVTLPLVLWLLNSLRRHALPAAPVVAI